MAIVSDWRAGVTRKKKLADRRQRTAFGNMTIVMNALIVTLPAANRVAPAQDQFRRPTLPHG